MSTQKARVLQAFLDGARTTVEASAATGLAVKHCSAYARALVTAGLLHDKPGPFNAWRRGRTPHFYEPKAAI